MQLPENFVSTMSNNISREAKSREGRCETCGIHWVWMLNVPLKSQVCAKCGRALRRITAKSRTHGETVLTWEGYRP